MIFPSGTASFSRSSAIAVLTCDGSPLPPLCNNSDLGMAGRASTAFITGTKRGSSQRCAWRSGDLARRHECGCCDHSHCAAMKHGCHGAGEFHRSSTARCSSIGRYRSGLDCRKSRSHSGRLNSSAHRTSTRHRRTQREVYCIGGSRHWPYCSQGHMRGCPARHMKSW